MMKQADGLEPKSLKMR